MKRSANKAVKRSRKRTKKASTFKNIIGFCFKWSAVGIIWCAVIIAGIVTFFAYDLPNIESALSEVRKPVITLLAVDGRKITNIGPTRGSVVQHADLPDYLSQAIIATEDRRFFKHIGIDLVGIVRAAFVNFRAGRIIQGGSTITQQAAKNLFLTSDRTLKRKIQEVLLAFWLEYNFSKHQIEGVLIKNFIFLFFFFKFYFSKYE